MAKSVGKWIEFTMRAREGEDVVTLRREEVVALIGLIDYEDVDENDVLSARAKLVNKIPRRLRPRSPQGR